MSACHPASNEKGTELTLELDVIFQFGHFELSQLAPPPSEPKAGITYLVKFALLPLSLNIRQIRLGHL